MRLFRVYVDGNVFYHPNLSKLAITEAKVSEDAENIDADVFAEMITGAVEGIQDISPAQVGDKSLLDTLVPAKEAFVAAKEAGKEFAECLDEMNAAAEKGWQSTKDLVAKIGRASRLGERSRGVLDAGATSCYFIITTIGTAAKELL